MIRIGNLERISLYKLVNKDQTPAGTRACRRARILVPCARLSVVFSLQRRVVEEGRRTWRRNWKRTHPTLKKIELTERERERKRAASLAGFVACREWARRTSKPARARARQRKRTPNTRWKERRGRTKPSKGKELSNLVGCRFPPFCRACLSLFRRESEKIDCSRKWGWYTEEGQE